MRLSKPTTMNFSIGKIYLLFLCVIFIAACNNEETGSTTIVDSTVQTNNVVIPVKAALSAIADFPVLCIDSTEIRNILKSTPTPYKLVFNFNFDDKEEMTPSLKFYKSRNNGSYFGNSYKLTRATTPPYNLPGEINLGNLELRDAMLDRLTGKGSHLLFYPKISTRYPGNVTYLIKWGTCDEKIADFNLLVGEELNPSPPADPS
jgi:hypothetical protein